MQMIDILELLADGKTLSTEQTRSAIGQILAGECSDAEVASFLTALRVRGETVDELVGGRLALREQVICPRIQRKGLLDTCGIGGDLTGTFNISTAAAIVASACGAAVAKHGSRSISSNSGSADVLKTLGVNIEVEADVVCSCVDELGLGFFFAPQWRPAMKPVMAVRKQLRFRTIFNLLGPISNPAAADYQLLGVGRMDWADKLAETLRRMGARSAIIVTGADGLDEVTLAESTRALHVRAEAIVEEIWTPESFGLPRSTAADWRVCSPEESAKVIEGVLRGAPGPARDMVLANTAAALRAAQIALDLKEGVRLAAKAIDTGAARAQLDELIRRTNQKSIAQPGDVAS